MTAVRCAAALLLLGCAGAAQAKSFAWCQMIGGNYEAYLSGIVEIDDGPAAFRDLRTGSFARGFKDYVRSRFDARAKGFDCTAQQSMFFARDYIDVLVTANPGIRFVRTDWRGTSRSAALTGKAGAGQ